MTSSFSPAINHDNPVAFLHSLHYAYCFSKAVSETCALGVPDILKAHGPLTADQIVAYLSQDDSPAFSRLPSPPLPSLLHRTLRAAAHVGVYDEVVGPNGENFFSLTITSEYLCSDHPESIRWWMAHEAGSPVFDMWGAFSDIIRTGKHASEIIHGYDSCFEWFQSMPKEELIFQRAMLQSMNVSIAEVKKIDFSGFKHCVDIGGSLGHVLKPILQSHPNLKGTVFDLPQIAHESENANIDDPIMGDKARVAYIGGDFFESIPHSDFFVVSRVLHDWDDDKCVEILTNIAASIEGDNGRLFVIDSVMSPFGKGTRDYEDGVRYSYDLHMMVICKARERTIDDFSNLFKRAGLEYVNDVHLKNTHLNIIEAKKV